MKGQTAAAEDEEAFRFFFAAGGGGAPLPKPFPAKHVMAGGADPGGRKRRADG